MALQIGELQLNGWAASGRHNELLNLLTGPFRSTWHF